MTDRHPLRFTRGVALHTPLHHPPSTHTSMRTEEQVTKSDLIESVASTSTESWTKKDVEGAVNTIFKAMTDALVDGDRIEIRGLGSFRVKERMPRIGRNPKTGERVSIPARKVPHFTVGKHLKVRVEDS